jgi:hypothetical protein
MMRRRRLGFEGPGGAFAGPTRIRRVLALDRPRDGPRQAFGRVVHGGEEIAVRVLDLDAARSQSDLDAAAFVRSPRIREANGHRSDPIVELRQGEAQAILDVRAESLGDLEVVLMNAELHESVSKGPPANRP